MCFFVFVASLPILKPIVVKARTKKGKSMFAFKLLKNVTKVVLPIAVGGGLIDASHGLLHSPAPATLEILSMKGLFFFGGPVMGELATPTGVAILSNLVDISTMYVPPLKSKG